MIVTKVFEFENCVNTEKFKQFKYAYATKMSKVMEFNSLECTIEGLKSGLYSSYEYIDNGTIYIGPEGISKDIETFTVSVKPSNKADTTKQYFRPDELNIVVEYEEDD